MANRGAARLRYLKRLRMLLFQFVALQILDIATTLLFLRQGVREANPILGAALA